jgi:hypothetical protein
MSEPTLKKMHDLLENLATYVMNEAPTKQQVEKRFLQIEREIERKADKDDLIAIQEDLSMLKKNTGKILNGMDGMVKNLEIIRTEQSAFISSLRRIENRVEVLEKKTA